MNRTTTKPEVLLVCWKGLLGSQTTEMYIRDALGASLRSGHRCLHMTHRAYQFPACDIRSATYALIVIHHDTPYKRVLVYRWYQMITYLYCTCGSNSNSWNKAFDAQWRDGINQNGLIGILIYSTVATNSNQPSRSRYRRYYSLPAVCFSNSRCEACWSQEIKQ